MQRRHFLLHVPLAAAGASAAALALGGCGFHLREAPVLVFHSIYIEGDPKSVIVSRLRRLLAPQVRIVTEDRARLIDRAWQATLRALRSFTRGPAPEPTA